jgi:hypothetical protein
MLFLTMDCGCASLRTEAAARCDAAEGQVVIQARWADTGSPAADLQFSIAHQSNGCGVILVRGRTNASGKFTFLLPKGTYLLTIEDGKSLKQETSLVVFRGQIVEVSLVIEHSKLVQPQLRVPDVTKALLVHAIASSTPSGVRRVERTLPRGARSSP